MERLVSALARLELDDDLYDEWEGESIHFFDNICDYGEAPGRHDRIVQLAGERFWKISTVIL